jgi:hypothetical protein
VDVHKSCRKRALRDPCKEVIFGFHIDNDDDDDDDDVVRSIVGQRRD